MGLLTLFLVFVIGRYTVVGKIYSLSRKFLSTGTFLVTIHFILQYLLHKSAPENEETIRSLINLSFGIPMSYLFNISNYNLLCKSRIHWVNWFMAPVVFVFAMITLVVCHLTGEMTLAVTLMAVMYAFTLIHYGVLQIREYFYVVHKIRTKEDLSLLPYIKWTRWSLFFMVIISFGFPIMTFVTDLLLRSLYGLISISSSFFYALCFMGYGINGTLSSSYAMECGQPVAKPTTKKHRSVNEELKMQRLLAAVDEFIKKGSYLRNGITQKEAADEMKISPYRLKTWLNSTEYENFSRWILYLRLEKVKELLLRDPDMGGDELAEQCGFCDRQYLQRSFRKWTGMTPSQWVKQNVTMKKDTDIKKDTK